MNRHALEHAQWKLLEPFLPGKSMGLVSNLGIKKFIDAAIWKLKTGVSWRDQHEQFGPWKTIYNRFRN